jgi:phosphoadenosine phosphosulfate reductase
LRAHVNALFVSDRRKIFYSEVNFGGVSKNSMSHLQEIWSVSTQLNTAELLAYLIREKFAGRTVVTASLRSRSIVVLKMVADIDPATPVLFCRPGYEFEESRTYRDKIINLLGLTDVRFSDGRETEVASGDQDHVERMWMESENVPGQSFRIAHINKSLETFDCWISAVYHEANQPNIKHRVDLDGRLIRVNPILHWTQDEVREFMREHNLPYHQRAKRKQVEFKPDQVSEWAPYGAF